MYPNLCNLSTPRLLISCTIETSMDQHMRSCCCIAIHWHPKLLLLGKKLWMLSLPPGNRQVPSYGTSSELEGSLHPKWKQFVPRHVKIPQWAFWDPFATQLKRNFLRRQPDGDATIRRLQESIMRNMFSINMLILRWKTVGFSCRRNILTWVHPQMALFHVIVVDRDVWRSSVHTAWKTRTFERERTRV